MSEQGQRLNRKDTPGGIITARAFKYASSFYDFADKKFPELKGYPPDNGRCTLLQAAIIVSTLIQMERRTRGAGWEDLHTSVTHAFASSVRGRHLSAIQDIACSLLDLDRGGLKPAAIPSFSKLADAPDAATIGSIGLWLTRAIAQKRNLEPGDLTLAAALGRSAWTSATMIARMLSAGAPPPK
jgi:hypothetical protein